MKRIKLFLSVGEYDAVLEFGKYRNNRTAIECIDPEDGESIAVATVNLPDSPLNDDEVFIKDYSENEGILSSLIANNIVSDPIDVIPSGFVVVYKCKLLYHE